jgi:DNA repair protein RecN (Recombination protein N)
MLTELSIKNFAIIDSLQVSFDSGLSVLTGETGAGKSIIIDAIGLLIGGRGSSEFVRFGKEKAELEGLFTIHKNHYIHDVAEEYGIDINDEMVILRRDISANGKSVCRVNGKMVTISVLKQVGSMLIDVHGQHENQVLMNDENHILLLDQYGSSNVNKELSSYRQIFSDYKAIKEKLKQLTHDDQQMAQRVDLLQFQINEIEKANLIPNEDEQLMEEKQKLLNFEKLHTALQGSYDALTSDGQGLDAIGIAMRHLEDIAEMDEKLKEFSEIVSSAFYQIQETTYSIRDYYDTLEYDESRLNEIEARLNEIYVLKRKYGKDVQEILQYCENIKEELETLTNHEEHLLQLQKELSTVTNKLFASGKKLSKIRKQVANELKNEIMKELKDLYMDKAIIEIAFHKSDVQTAESVHFTKNGIDNIEFLISTNPGEPVKPLAKVASGGEISRIMLALKTIFSQHQGLTSIIFDEVDTGVSGRVAQAIAEKISKLSTGSQVLCITHLPQVAAMSDTHLYISKHEKEDRTYTKITPLNEEDKIKEIGRMISGVEVTQLTKEHARELLQLANKLKASS